MKCLRLGRSIWRSTISMPGFMQNAPSPLNVHTVLSGTPWARPAANIDVRLMDASR